MPRRRSNLGIYDPPEPTPNLLPPDAREKWDRAYANALRTYGNDAHGRQIAESTAWRMIRMRWKPGAQRVWEACSGGTCMTWPRPQTLPKPQADLVGLGVLIEYGYVDRNGDLQIVQTDRDLPPILWWDDARKLLYAFPGRPYPGCMLGPEQMPEAAEVYRRWTKRNMNCGDVIQIPIVQLHCLGAADTVSYRSDKWKEKMDDPRVIGAQEYIHKHWHDVWLWQDRKTNPKAIMIEGGELDVHSKGIIH